MTRGARPARSALLCTVGLLLACEGPALTEIVVVVDTDLDVPGELDTVRIDVVGLGAQPLAAADLSTTPLPLTLGLVHEGGALGPISIGVTGLRGIREVVIERRHEVYFAPGSVRVVRMDLLRECLGVTCAADETCAAGGCRSIVVSATELPEWSGPPAALAHDGGVGADGVGADDAGAIPAAGAGPPPDAAASCPPICTTTLSCDGTPCRCTAGMTCSFTCQTGDCDAVCSGDSQCHIQNGAADSFDVLCTGDASCVIDADDASRVSVYCEDDSSCEVSCRNVPDCELYCEQRSGCVVRCNTTDDCRMRSCSGRERRDCGGGVHACRRPCP